jgi:hypothetical protein
MNEFNEREADDESKSDLQLNDQLRELEQELRLTKPVSPITSPDSMFSHALSATLADRSVNSGGTPVILATEPSETQTSKKTHNHSRWIAAIACSWLLGAMVGALAMWAATSREAGPLTSDLAENVENIQLNQDNQSNLPSSRTPANHVVGAKEDRMPQNVRLESLTYVSSNNSSYRHIDIEDVMGSTQLTVFNAKHRASTVDGTGESDAYPDGDQGDEFGSSQNSPLDSSAAPTTRTNLMESLVF